MVSRAYHPLSINFNSSKHVKRARKWYLNKFYLSYFFRFMLEEYLTIVLCVVINFYAIVFKGKSINFGSSISSIILSTLTLLVFPIVTIRVLKKYQNQYDSKTFNKMYGALSEGLIRRAPNLLFFNSTFLVRRILTAVIIVLLRDYPGCQPPLLLVLSTLSFALTLQLHPYDDRRQFYLELFNELSIWLCSLSFFLMTDYVQDYHFRELSGWILVCTTLASVGVNLLACLWFTASEIISKLSRKCKSTREETVKVDKVAIESTRNKARGKDEVAEEMKSAEQHREKYSSKFVVHQRRLIDPRSVPISDFEATNENYFRVFSLN